MTIIKITVSIFFIIMALCFMVSGIKSEIRSYKKDALVIKDIVGGLNFFNKKTSKQNNEVTDSVAVDVSDAAGPEISGDNRDVMETELIEKYHQNPKSIKSLSDKELEEIYRFWTT